MSTCAAESSAIATVVSTRRPRASWRDSQQHAEKRSKIVFFTKLAPRTKSQSSGLDEARRVDFEEHCGRRLVLKGRRHVNARTYLDVVAELPADGHLLQRDQQVLHRHLARLRVREQVPELRVRELVHPAGAPHAEGGAHPPHLAPPSINQSINQSIKITNNK
eukprot:1194564-Prorocentrum_minimum.AAC.2